MFRLSRRTTKNYRSTFTKILLLDELDFVH